MWHRILAIFVARNREFYRDTAGLAWNILMPILMIVGFAFIFRGDAADVFKIGVIGDAPDRASVAASFLELRHVSFVPVADPSAGQLKVERHQLDLLLDLRAAPVYWVNVNSAKGYLAERLLLGAGSFDEFEPVGGPQRQAVTGEALRYADWVLPGILAMNIMFSSLWGVGWVVVRYRKNGVLRRLKATPLSPFEFLSAQVLSRLFVVLAASLVVYVGAQWLLDFPMRGSYLALVLIYTAGALCMISLGLMVAARLRTEELADGVLNLITWPMLLLSGVWFSMDGTSPAAQAVSQALPLTHLVDGARLIMIDGAGIAEVWPQIALLTTLALGLLAIAARLFRWE
ncbi:ABC transporter permease [Thioalkalicoccus limnaeus]|uniref:Transport permease protein n=1 Tax=Thioalkalicoccus limnaeus TaxID=120681 RepID=A0ABV4BB72_9GAMM